ncbi:hypothetical protein, partial [uncultured Corynebacterium sp.]|uniref:hypothetical protein n=1 Tax=uncultured Corynebacterium sp. TaxID=159447 RepID=UPI00262C50C8
MLHLKRWNLQPGLTRFRKWMALLRPGLRGTWPQQSVPEKRMFPELTADGAEKVILQSTSLEDVRERRQNIHHGTSIEIPEPALG